MIDRISEYDLVGKSTARKFFATLSLNYIQMKIK